MDNTDLKPIFARGQRKALLALGIGAVALIIGGLVLGSERFWQAYLYGYIFWVCVTFGGLSILMIHHIVAGAWGFLIQRILEAASRTLPIMAILFIPIATIALPVLYEWHPVQLEAAHHGHEEVHYDDPYSAAAAAAARDHAYHQLHHTTILNKLDYLNPADFRWRAVLYFAVLLALMYLLNSASLRMDQTRDEGLVLRLRHVSCLGAVFFVLCMTFATTDWTLSLEPTYFSTMYAPIFMVGQALAMLAISIVVLTKIKSFRPISEVYNLEYVHHLGNLLLAFTVLWAYTSFSQFLITWSGNLSEEIPYYLSRQGGGLTTVSLILMLFHFAVPFFILLWRRSKRSIGFLKTLALWMLVMRGVDLYWTITPAFSPNQFRLPIMEIFAFMAIGGVWMWWFCREIQKRPLLTERDPRQAVAFNKWEGAADHA